VSPLHVGMLGRALKLDGFDHDIQERSTSRS
jgi:hypothetical protein